MYATNKEFYNKINIKHFCKMKKRVVVYFKSFSTKLCAMDTMNREKF